MSFIWLIGLSFFLHTGCIYFLLSLVLVAFVLGLHFAWEDKMPCCIGLSLKFTPPSGDWLISKNTIKKNFDRLAIHFVLRTKYRARNLETRGFSLHCYITLSLILNSCKRDLRTGLAKLPLLSNKWN